MKMKVDSLKSANKPTTADGVSRLMILVSALAVFTSVFGITLLSFAWQNPTQNPPGGNLNSFLDTSSTTQTKTGGLNLATGGGNVGIGTTNPTWGRAQIEDATVPLAFRETGQTGAGSLWRMPLDDKVLRFDVSQNGTDFTSYVVPLAMTSNGNVGIGTTAPNARLSLTTTGTELEGTAASAALRINAGSLGTTAGNTLKLASIGFTSANNSSLGIEALRTANGTDWQTTAIGLKMDVDNTSPVNNAQIWLTSSGNVGIGTTGPGDKLHVAGNIRIPSGGYGINNENGSRIFDTGWSAAFGDYSAISTGYAWEGNTGAYEPMSVVAGGNAIFFTRGNPTTHAPYDTILMTIRDSGNVGIGTTNPYNLLSVEKNVGSNYIQRIFNTYNGPNRRQLVIYQAGTATPATSDIYIAFSNSVNWGVNGSISGNGSGGVQYNTTSDRRLKTNLKIVNDALKIINQINPYYFEFIFKPGERNIGFIAQDLIDTYPYAVSGDPNSDPLINPMQIDYSKFTPLLLAGIKEQQSQIASLSAQISKLYLSNSGDLGIIKTGAEHADDGNFAATQSSQIISNTTIGTGILPAGTTEVTIFTTKVTPNSFIYITPTTTTNDHVLYLKSQTVGVGFVVGFDSPVSHDVKFNWWIVN